MNERIIYSLGSVVESIKHNNIGVTTGPNNWNEMTKTCDGGLYEQS
jgi:hypothetical protein